MNLTFYEVPNGWEIVSDGKMFTVRKDDRNDLYLCETLNGTQLLICPSSNPVLFFSEGKAKAYLKEYLKYNNFK